MLVDAFDTWWKTITSITSFSMWRDWQTVVISASDRGTPTVQGFVLFLFTEEWCCPSDGGNTWRSGLLACGFRSRAHLMISFDILIIFKNKPSPKSPKHHFYRWYINHTIPSHGWFNLWHCFTQLKQGGPENPKAKRHRANHFFPACREQHCELKPTTQFGRLSSCCGSIIALVLMCIRG